MTANSRKVFDKSFSRAKDKLFPSIDHAKHGSVSNLQFRLRQKSCRLTDDESELLKISCTSRVFDSFETFREEISSIQGVFLNDDYLWISTTQSAWRARKFER